MSYFDRTIMSIAGPEIMKEFGVAPERMGWVYSSAILSYAIFMIPGGDLADRMGPRKTLLLMGLSAALFTALTPFGGHPALAFLGVVPVLIAIRFAFGAVSSPIYTACARMCAVWIPTHYLARVQAFIIAGACLGGAVSPIVFSWLISVFRWRGSFYIAGAITALLGNRAPRAAPVLAAAAAESQPRASHVRVFYAGLLRIHFLLLDLLLLRRDTPHRIYAERALYDGHFSGNAYYDACGWMGFRYPDSSLRA